MLATRSTRSSRSQFSSLLGVAVWPVAFGAVIDRPPQSFLGAVPLWARRPQRSPRGRAPSRAGARPCGCGPRRRRARRALQVFSARGAGSCLSCGARLACRTRRGSAPAPVRSPRRAGVRLCGSGLRGRSSDRRGAVRGLGSAGGSGGHRGRTGGGRSVGAVSRAVRAPGWVATSAGPRRRVGSGAGRRLGGSGRRGSRPDAPAGRCSVTGAVRADQLRRLAPGQRDRGVTRRRGRQGRSRHGRR